MNQRRTDNTMA